MAITLRTLNVATLSALLAPSSSGGSAAPSLVAPVEAILASDGDAAGALQQAGGSQGSAANARSAREPGQDGAEQAAERRGVNVADVRVVMLSVSVDVSIIAPAANPGASEVIQSAAEAAIRTVLANPIADAEEIAVTVSAPSTPAPAEEQAGAEEAPARRRRTFARRLFDGSSSDEAKAPTVTMTLAVKVDCGLNPAATADVASALSQLSTTQARVQLPAQEESKASQPAPLVMLFSTAPTAFANLSVTLNGTSGALSMMGRSAPPALLALAVACALLLQLCEGTPDLSS